jgi:hypothetical protein
LDIEICNINNLVDYRQRREAIAHYPLIVILHSAAGDRMSLLPRTAHWFQKRRGKLVVFLGNEYDLMDEKISFLQSVEADYVGSQLPLDTARWLYAECQSTAVLPLPHALNPDVFFPDAHIHRSIDIGFRGWLYFYFMGDIERNSLIRFFQNHGTDFGLRCDVQIGNLPRTQWAQFLNTCKGIIGAEAGSYYVDRRYRLLTQAKAYVKRHPAASFEEVFERFFQHPSVEYVSGKCISSRHFEQIGAKTCQVLLEGEYNKILKPDEHYISVKKDLSNIDEAIRRFKDDAYRTEMAERTYEYILDEHTYQHRVQALVKAVKG